MVGIGRNKFWYFATSLFVLWFILLCFYFSGLRSDKNHDVLLRNNIVETNENSNETSGEEKRQGEFDNFFIGGDWDKYIKEVKESTPDDKNRVTNNEAQSINNVLGIFDERIPEKLSLDVKEPKPDGKIRLTNNEIGSIDKVSVKGIGELPGVIVADKKIDVIDNIKNTTSEQPGINVEELSSNGENRLINNEARSIEKESANGKFDNTILEQPSLVMEGDQEGIASKSDQDLGESCLGKYIYVHNIPSHFNEDYLKHCRSLNQWSNMCPSVSNFGLGPLLVDSQKVFSRTGWFETNQFMLEVIFHNRMKQYKCLTNHSSLASAIFVPYYAGLDVARYLWNSHRLMRDHYSKTLIAWLRERPEWKRMWGRDHFLVAGRITWDFRRETEGNTDWGNKLMLWPESKNMTMLTIESSPWNSNDFGIPYPTYFHPSSDTEVFGWQDRMRRIKRRFLFSFAGAPRPNIPNSIRAEIIRQCQAARTKCKLLECVTGSSKCHQPVHIMKMFQGSTYCLQPPGDSYTRRSTFDSILAGCIPVFFHPGSAYVQYLWHLPRDYTKYSVFIPANKVKENNVNIESILSRIPRSKMLAMREQVINLIPGVVYANPSSNLETLQDAFDITIDGVLERIEGIRKDISEGKDVSNDGDEEFTWKKNLFGSIEKHEWDSFFKRS